MVVLLDTSVIIDALRRRRNRHGFLMERARRGDTFCCSVISVAEVYAGMKPSEQGRTEEFFRDLECIEITRETARLAGTYKYEWARKGTTLGIPDAIIAAVALSLDIPLATDNVDDFPMTDLKFLPLPEA
jgi:predicted nucleic acid-binding protein